MNQQIDAHTTSLAGMSKLHGRAAFRRLLKDAQAEQARVHLQMAQLKVDSKINTSPIFLELHRKASGNWTLRWRLRVGRAFKHVLWADIGVQLNAMPLALKNHYTALNARALELNTVDIVIQQTIKWLNNHLNKSRPAGADRLA